MRTIYFLIAFLISSPLATDEAQKIKKELQGTSFKFCAEKNGEIEVEIDFPKDLPKLANRARQWANGSLPPSTFMVIRGGKITKISMAADPWGAGGESVRRKTIMHCVAEKFHGEPATHENFKRLQAKMKLALELQFSD